MSRIGKKPVKVPSGVKVELKDRHLKISGSSASLELDVHPLISVEHNGESSELVVTRRGDQRIHRALHGTIRSLIDNMITGVTKGYEKRMQIFGTGYGVKQQGSDLVINVGFAQPVTFAIPAGITVEIKAPNTRGNDVPAEFAIKGADKWTVGQFASEIRRRRPPEPYKGKGIRYMNEVIRRKVGKAFGSA